MTEARPAGRSRHASSSPTLPPLFLLLSRLALSLTAAVLVLMPFTERFCTWDRFLRGGDDLELGLLATAALLSLVLLLAEHRGATAKGSLTAMATLTGWISLLFRRPAMLRRPGRAAASTIPAPERLTQYRSACPLHLRL